MIRKELLALVLGISMLLSACAPQPNSMLRSAEPQELTPTPSQTETEPYPGAVSDTTEQNPDKNTTDYVARMLAEDIEHYSEALAKNAMREYYRERRNNENLDPVGLETLYQRISNQVAIYDGSRYTQYMSGFTYHFPDIPASARTTVDNEPLEATIDLPTSIVIANDGYSFGLYINTNAYNLVSFSLPHKIDHDGNLTADWSQYPDREDPIGLHILIMADNSIIMNKPITSDSFIISPDDLNLNGLDYGDYELSYVIMLNDQELPLMSEYPGLSVTFEQKTPTLHYMEYVIG